MTPRLVLLLLLALLLVCPGCAQLGQYDRTYSLSYLSPDGQQIGGSVRLAPTRGLSK